MVFMQLRDFISARGFNQPLSVDDYQAEFTRAEVIQTSFKNNVFFSKLKETRFL